MSVTPLKAPPYPTTPENDRQDEEISTAAYAKISDFRKKIKFVIFQSFQWCFGFNKDIPVLNLSINNTKKIFFVAAQISVLYDFAND